VTSSLFLIALEDPDVEAEAAHQERFVVKKYNTAVAGTGTGTGTGTGMSMGMGMGVSRVPALGQDWG
jgi:hypothetical protein